jgi:phage terminase small subunit
VVIMPAREGAGRPAKPTNLKVLHGDRADRINTAEPVPEPGKIEPPADLSPPARANWDRLAPDRIAKQVLTAWDVDAFAQFCEALAMAKRAAALAHETGDPRPFREAVNTCATLGGRFGWTPADRAKLVVGEPARKPGEDLLTA